MTFNSYSLDYFSRAAITDIRQKHNDNEFADKILASDFASVLTGGFMYLFSEHSMGGALHNFWGTSHTPYLYAPAVDDNIGYSETGVFSPGATGACIKTNWNPSVDLAGNEVYTLLYNRTNVQAGSVAFGCAITSSNDQHNAILWNTDNTSKFRAFSGGTQISGANTRSDGYFAFGASSANSRKYIRRNGIPIADVSGAISGSRPNLEEFIFTRNLDSVSSNPGVFDFGLFIRGRGYLTPAQSDLLTKWAMEYNAKRSR